MSKCFNPEKDLASARHAFTWAWENFKSSVGLTDSSHFEAFYLLYGGRLSLWHGVCELSHGQLPEPQHLTKTPFSLIVPSSIPAAAFLCVPFLRPRRGRPLYSRLKYLLY